MKKIIASSKNRGNFIREIETLELVQHENVVRIYDYEIRDNHISIVMEYCDNTLYNYLKEAIYPLIKQNVKTIAHMILSGLRELHSYGILHRVGRVDQDIKPSNILISALGVVKIGDFGLAINIKDKDREGNFPSEGFTT